MNNHDKILENQTIFLTGGTGSLGRQIVKRIMSGEFGCPKKVIIFSRDENKHYQMKLEWKNLVVATDEVYYQNYDELLDFRIGDVRDYESMVRSIKESDIIIYAAALKHVPICEYFPNQSILTNLIGMMNIVKVLVENNTHVHTCVITSTDKSCKPVNVYGMCKAIQERLAIEANLQCPDVRFICVRYGNVIASSGSIIPLFQEQIKNGKEITITDANMTRFWLTLEQASEIVFDAMKYGKRGDTLVPNLDAFNIMDLAQVMIGNRNIPIKITGIRPGEKIHEILVSEEELFRTIRRGKYYVILPILPELRGHIKFEPVLTKELSSIDKIADKRQLRELLLSEGLI